MSAKPEPQQPVVLVKGGPAVAAEYDFTTGLYVLLVKLDNENELVERVARRVVQVLDERGKP